MKWDERIGTVKRVWEDEHGLNVELVVDLVQWAELHGLWCWWSWEESPERGTRRCA